MKRFWVRFFSPGDDSRPVKVPAPCEWWCTGTGNSSTTICALVSTTRETVPWAELDKWWPGLEPDSQEEVPLDFRPGDRFPPKPPSENGWMEKVFE